jgi:hypothetical protein
MTRVAIVILVMPALFLTSESALAEPPCDRYPKNEQRRCAAIWKQINAEAAPEVARFGMDQLKRRQAGEMTAEQHLQENTAFIKQSAEKRLKLLGERMGKE